MGPSIEAALKQAIQTILQHEVQLQAASRTDAGVHARAQIVNFLTEKPLCQERFQYSLNGLLPKQIAVTQVEKMPLDFHPTLDALTKEYEYQICTHPVQLPFERHTSWHFPYPLDLEQMTFAARHLEGKHDFSTFCNERPLWDRTPLCHLEKVEVSAVPGRGVKFLFVGDHFLYRMARNLAGTLAYVGCGKIQAKEIPSILQGKDRTRAGMTAPAHGLMLTRVSYEHSIDS
jgi:tRNA pseudouridine38-40 synthase